MKDDVIGLVVVLVIAVILFTLGMLAADGASKSSCDDFGKVRLYGKVYECQ